MNEQFFFTLDNKTVIYQLNIKEKVIERDYVISEKMYGWEKGAINDEKSLFAIYCEPFICVFSMKNGLAVSSSE